MRVTSSFSDRNFLDNLSQIKTRMDKAQRELSTGKRVNRLADDPLAASRSAEIAIRSSINDQFLANNDQLRSKFELVDSTLQGLILSLDQAKVLAFQALSGTTTDTTRQALAEGVDGVKQQVLSDANARFNGSYLFAGSLTNNEPFVDSGGGTISYVGNDETVFQRLDRSTVIQGNITGERLFESAPPVFSVLDDLQTAILANDTANIEARLDELETISDRVNNIATEVGSQLQLLDQVRARLNDHNLALQTEDSRLTDANLVESISKFDQASQALNASLSSRAHSQGPTLIDFLR